MARFIFTSKGLTTEIGRKLIGEQIAEDGGVEGRKIALFYEPYGFIRDQLVKTCIEFGFKRENIILPSEEMNFDTSVDFIYVSEGNTFEIISKLRSIQAVDYIRQVCANPLATYIGASAGCLLSGESIFEAGDWDRNYEGIEDFTGLNLHSCLVLPHYNKKQLRRYVKTSKGLLKRYKHVFNVEDSGILVLNSMDMDLVQGT